MGHIKLTHAVMSQIHGFYGTEREEKPGMQWEEEDPVKVDIYLNGDGYTFS